MRNQPPVEVWLAKLSTGACLRRPKAIVVDTEGTQTICDKHGHGSCDLTSCLDTLREMAPEIPTCWKRLAAARYARMKSYYTAVSTSAAVLVGMLTL